MVFLKESFPTGLTGIAAFSEVEKRFLSQWFVFDRLETIIVDTVCFFSAAGANVVSAGQFQMYVKNSPLILHICDNNLFQIKQLCGKIMVEHKEISPFVCCRGTSILKDFFFMLYSFFKNRVGCLYTRPQHLL